MPPGLHIPREYVQLGSATESRISGGSCSQGMRRSHKCVPRGGEMCLDVKGHCVKIIQSCFLDHDEDGGSRSAQETKGWKYGI